MRLLLAALLALGLIQSAYANPNFELGPAVGVEAPSIGTPDDHTGKPRSLESLMGENGLVLLFYRSAAWCPYCQTQLMDLNKGVSEIEKRGYTLVGVSYDAPKVLAGFVSKRSIKYPLLSDPKSEIIDRYGLRDPQYKAGSFAYGVPQPIILFIDRKGVVTAKLYEDTYKKRPPVGLVIETLDNLKLARK
ncbi:MAG: peroxiredoxin family protein [Rhodospirillaceae bacterium]|nr:peroxiredoxin family protein [Rhodospirillaceae bacterium]